MTDGRKLPATYRESAVVADGAVWRRFGPGRRWRSECPERREMGPKLRRVVPPEGVVPRALWASGAQCRPGRVRMP